MITAENPLYYSNNKDLQRPEPESEKDFVGELHTATSVIAQVEDEDGAKDIVKICASFHKMKRALQIMEEALKGGNINKRSTAFAVTGENVTYMTIVKEALKSYKTKK